jgi:aminoglycoside 6'-N-acetyltransferase I
MVQEMAEHWANLANAPIFVAERPEGQLCGLMEVSMHESAPGCTATKIGYLEAWYVDPDCRQQGLGGRLVAVAEAWANEQGCTEMASDTSLPSYPLSSTAHTCLGYQIVKVEQAETEQLIYFQKYLAKSNQ